MTRADEARFIELWNAGTEAAAIAQQLGIPRSTVGSRAKRLVIQGKIQPRPRGGAYPRQQAQTRQQEVSVQSSAEQRSAEQRSAAPHAGTLVPSPAVGVAMDRSGR